MASSKKEKSIRPVHDSPVIPLKYQHMAAVAVVFLSLIIFFHELVFERKVFVAADNIASKSFQTLVNERVVSDNLIRHELVSSVPLIFCWFQA